jgi:hypothetical protein
MWLNLIQTQVKRTNKKIYKKWKQALSLSKDSTKIDYYILTSLSLACPDWRIWKLLLVPMLWRDSKRNYEN